MKRKRSVGQMIQTNVRQDIRTTVRQIIRMYLVYGGKRVGGFNNANYDLHTVGMLVSRNVPLTRLSVQRLKTFSSERRGLACHREKRNVDCPARFNRSTARRRSRCSSCSRADDPLRIPLGETTFSSRGSASRRRRAGRSARCFPSLSSFTFEPVADRGQQRSEEEHVTVGTTREAPAGISRPVSRVGKLGPVSPTILSHYGSST